MKKKLLIIFPIILIIILLVTLAVRNPKKTNLKHCKPGNIAEWNYSGNYELCYLDDGLLVFDDNDKALKEINRQYHSDITLIDNKITNKNIDKYNIRCSDNKDEDLKVFCTFFLEFYKVYKNRY